MIIEEIHQALFDARDDEPRTYLGSSVAAHPCERFIWYEANQVQRESAPPKILLTFAIGKAIEEIILNLLNNNGSVILPSEKNNFLKVTTESNTITGHPDGIYLDKNHNKYILEIKSAKNSEFNVFKKHGVQKWRIQYYGQCQTYMGASDIHKCVFLVVNKDTSEMYVELVPFDADYYERLILRVELIKSLKLEPNRINNSPLYYMCSVCKFKGVCHGEDVTAISTTSD